MSVENLVAKIIVEKLQPDFTALREEIAKHQFVRMKDDLDCTGSSWNKVLFTTSESAIVQEVELTFNQTRFRTHNVAFGAEWKNKFVNWIDADNECYIIVLDCWERGMAMYGANVRERYKKSLPHDADVV
jgi:hypothetical protein